MSQSQKKVAGANFNVRSEAAIALNASDARKRACRAPRFATDWPLGIVDARFTVKDVFSDSLVQSNGQTVLTDVLTRSEDYVPYYIAQAAAMLGTGTVFI